MEEGHHFLTDILTTGALLLGAALVAVLVFRKLGLGAVLGYLVAGIIIGPDVLGLSGEPETILSFAEIGIILLTVPVFMPIVQHLGFDPIWFGVVVTMMVEIAQISPPDGTVMYVLQGMRTRAGPITDVFMGVMPFLAAYLFAVGLLLVFPELALWLPRALGFK